MALVRVLSKVDANGKIAIPGNILREAGMKKGEPIEIRVTGGSAKYILILSGHSPGLKRRPKPKSRIPIPAR